jgi:hypothetical protein
MPRPRHAVSLWLLGESWDFPLRRVANVLVGRPCPGRAAAVALGELPRGIRSFRSGVALFFLLMRRLTIEGSKPRSSLH